MTSSCFDKCISFVPSCHKQVFVTMCVNPLKLRTTKKEGNNFNPLIHRIINIVPCGKCYECISQKSNDWYARALEEYEETKRKGGLTLYVTLTYNNDNLPRLYGIPCFSQEHLSQFFKNLRKENLSFKYLFSSEYGSQTHRPHYHLLLHFISFHSVSYLQNLIRKHWRFGFSYFGLNNGVVNSSIAIKYVTKYVCKDFHAINYVYSKGLDKDIKELVTKTRRGSVDYTFNNFHHASINYGSSLADKLTDEDFIRGYYYRITTDNVQQKFVIPFYIQRKCLYNVAYLFNGSPVYVYNSRYLSLFVRKQLFKYNDLKLKLQVVQDRIFEFFNKTNLDLNSFRSLIVDFKECDVDKLARYIVFYRGFSDLNLFDFDFRNDLNLFSQLYITQSFIQPIQLNPDNFKAQLIPFYERLYNFYVQLLMPYKYELYIQNSQSFRINQIFRSFKSGKVKKQIVFSFPQYVNYCFKKVA